MPHPRVHNSDLLDRIDHVSAKLAECINLAQTTLDEYGVPYFKNRPVTRSHNPQSDDIFAHLDRVDNTLLDCIKLAENTLNAQEYDTPEARLNQDFDKFINGLKHPCPLDHIEITPEFLNPDDDREFINYLNSLDHLDTLDDLDDWSDDIDLFMEGL